LPEACDPSRFDARKPLAARSLTVLELGRKLERVHARIVGPLREAEVAHRFATRGSSTILFPGVDGLYAGLADTAIALCYPKSDTHPDQAGGVETMTQRYLEFIGSGCLAVGRAPRELVDLFGFDPVIALDESDPAGHILAIARDLARWQAHADRCRARLLEVGTFDARAASMLAVLRQRGYDVGTGAPPPRQETRT
jgi:hypothetical protein